MKIERLHVVGFGKLTDKIYNFEEVTSILSENGEGKSTLASFIEGMFYGLEAKNSELRSYKPWNSTTFGGSMTFSSNGKTYRVERFWGSRKADDTFALFSMPEKKPCQDFTEKLGEELFGIDRSGFKRTCFFNSEDYHGGESSIQSRLNSLIADTDEFNSFDKITSNIEKEIKTYENAQHRGKLPEVKREIEELRTQISILSSSPELYQQTQSEQERLSNEARQLKAEIKLLEEQTEQKILSSANGSEKALEILKAQEENLKSELDKSSKVLNGYKLSPNTLSKLGEEKRKLDAVEKKLFETESALSSQSPYTRPLPTFEQLASAKEKVASLKATPDSKVSNKSGLSIGLILIALSLIVLGAINFSRLYICIPFSICAVVFLGVAIVTLTRGKNRTNKEVEELKSQIDGFLLSFGYGGYDISTALNLMENELNLREEFNAKRQSLLAQKSTLTQEHEQIKRNIDGFFAKFNLFGGYEENFYTLKVAMEKVELTEEKLSSLQMEKAKYSVKSQESDEVSQLKLKRTEKEKLLAEIQRQGQDNKINLVSLSERITKLNDLTSKRAFLVEEQRKLEEEKYILEQTLICLKTAKDNLTSGAYEPIKNSLKRYCGLLLPNYEGIRVDNDFKITCELGGATRDFSTFSQGQKQLINFALRLGLIDALFEKEKPFIIIDDAFSPLDEVNFDLCKKLVAEIGKTMQVIYLTPHPSRSL